MSSLIISFIISQFSIPNHSQDISPLPDREGNFTPSALHIKISDPKFTRIGASESPPLINTVTNKCLTVAILHDPPYTFVKVTTNGLQVRGYDIDVLKCLSSAMNFRYTFVKAKENVYGQLVNDSWNGLLGILQRKEADVVLPSFSRTDERVKVTDISAPISNSFSRFLIRKPGHVAVLQAYTSPFHLHVWITLLSITALAIVLLAATLSLSPLRHRRHSREGVVALSFIISVGFICQQDAQYIPRVVSTRILILASLFTSLMSFAYYSSDLVAFLTVRKIAVPFENMAQLIGNNEYSVGYVQGTAYEELLQPGNPLNCAKPKLYQQLYRKINDNPAKNLVASNRAGIAKAYRENYAFFSWVDGMLWDLQGNGNFMFIKEQYLNSYYGLAFPVNSPYVETFSVHILKLTESGILKRLKLRYFLPLDVMRTEARALGPIELKQFVSVFFVLATGIGASLTMTIAERIWSGFNSC